MTHRNLTCSFAEKRPVELESIGPFFVPPTLSVILKGRDDMRERKMMNDRGEHKKSDKPPSVELYFLIVGYKRQRAGTCRSPPSRSSKLIEFLAFGGNTDEDYILSKYGAD